MCWYFSIIKNTAAGPRPKANKANFVHKKTKFYSKLDVRVFLAAGAIYCNNRLAFSTQNITEFSRPLFAAIMYLNKAISGYNKKYVIVLPIIRFIIITNATWRM